MKSYVVTAGQYSDYHILACFSTREKADEFSAWYNTLSNYYQSSTEEFELDLPAVMQAREGYSIYRVLILKDGTIESIENEGQKDLFKGTRCWFWRRAKAPAYLDKGVSNTLMVHACAKTEKHAIKIANEKRTQWIAENRWEE